MAEATPSNEKPVVPMKEALIKRHSTRNFNKKEWTQEEFDFVQSVVNEANELPKPFGTDFTLVLAPKGFGLLNFIVNEKGWIFAKVPLSPEQKMVKFDIGYLFEYIIMRLTQHNVGTCFIAGTYLQDKAITFCGGNCDVPAVIAFGGEDSDRWLDSFVKWCGSFRGANTFKDKFFDLKQNIPITEESAGERMDACQAAAKIPCAMKPHAYRVIFDEPLIHIYDDPPPNSKYSGYSLYDIGNVVTNLSLYYKEVENKTVKVELLQDAPQCPLGGKYICSLSI